MILAYLDLGAGSLLLQMIMAGILGLTFTIKTYWRRIVAFIRRDQPGVPPAAETTATEEKR